MKSFDVDIQNFNCLAELMLRLELVSELYFNIISISNEDLEIIYRSSEYGYIHQRFW